MRPQRPRRSHLVFLHVCGVAGGRSRAKWGRKQGGGRSVGVLPRARRRAERAVGGLLQVDAPRHILTPDVIQRLVDHKAELLRLLADADGDDDRLDIAPDQWIERISVDGRRGWVRSDVADIEVMDIPAPCSTCGDIMFWWDVAGGRHCEHCRPPRHDLMDYAQRLRGRVPSTPDGPGQAPDIGDLDTRGNRETSRSPELNRQPPTGKQGMERSSDCPA